MKTKYLSILACVCMLALGFTSCEKQLDIEQHGVLDYSTFYQTDEEAEQAATAIYEQLRGAVFNYTMILNSLGDDFWSGGGARNDNADLEQFNEFTYGTEAGYIQGLFQTFYSVIYKCNVVLGHVEGGTEIQDRSLAEAHVLRAWAYFNLINLWGTPPVVDHELEASEYSRPNGTKEELWGLVVSDLETAINSGKLPEKSSVNDKSLWRTTKQFAQAMLGKAYMWQGNYSAAITQFEAVMSSGKYALYDDYENLLQYGHQRNCEMMFESNRVVDPNNVFNNTDIVPLMINWRTDKMTVPSSVGLYSTGWGFLCPQKSLYEDFVEVEGKDGYRLNATMKTFEQVQEMGCTVNTAIINEGYFMWKWRIVAEQMPAAGYGFVNGNSTRWMRYAEVILLAAEAYFESGNQAKADECMNMIRTRAKAPTKSGYTRDEIRREKRIELCGEFTRWMDIIRWGIAYDLLKNQGEKLPMISSNGEVTYYNFNTNANLYGFKQNKHELLPFPGTEVRLNDQIVQNPGW